MPQLQDALAEKRAVTVFCDGSLLYRGGRVVFKRGIAGGRGTSYDADICSQGEWVSHSLPNSDARPYMWLRTTNPP